TDKIGKAGSAVTVTWADGSGTTYDGNAHSATAGWASTGADGANAAGLTVFYVGINGTSYTATTTPPTDAGQYRASASFAGDATIDVTPYSVTYDGASHSATGSATGVKSETLAGLDLAGTTHTAAGSYTDTWTFTDTTGN